MERLRRVALLYPDRGIEFVVRSCTTPDRFLGDFADGSYTIPSTRLVYFFVLIGDIERAKAHLAAMVSTLLDETRMFTLPTPAWAEPQAEIDAGGLALYLLVARLKSGVSTTRVWAMQEIADLLWLFEMAFERGFMFSKPVSISRVGSCLAAHLCEMLGISYTKSPILAAHDGFSDARSFFEVDGLPGMLFNDLQRLQSVSNFSWISQATFEATRLSEAVYYSRSVEFFFGSIRGPRFGALLSNATQIARSAYLRTLFVANQTGGIPSGTALDWSNAAVPLVPLLMKMRPHEPEYWRVLCQAGREDVSDLSSLISDLLRSSNSVDHVVGALNASIYISENEFWNLELVLFAHQPQMSSDELISELAPEEKLSEALSLDIFSDEGFYECSNTSKKTKHKRARNVVLRFIVFPHGYLHSDVFARGVYLPVPAEVEEEFWVGPDAHGISIHSAERCIGNFSYWNTEWSAAYPAMKGPGCATSLTLCRDALSDLKHEISVLAYRCSITRYRRDQGYGEFEGGRVEHMVFEFE
jgi:hypothetical protein